MSQRVKKIKKKLDAFADNHRKFGLAVNSHHPVRRRVETCSYADVGDVVGREDDLKALIHMLLDSDSGDDVGFLTIVGVGGLGKSTLSQLVYNDERVKDEFPLRLWVCVSDQNDVKTVIAKILESATSKKHDAFAMDLLQSNLQREIGGKKCLLVLDDVWNENRYKWLDLRKFLIFGGKGSKVIVTTRSKMTASIISCERGTYELKGLSKLNSWRLFEMTAFGLGHNQDYPPELVEIGGKIVEKCHNSPLAIKVVGSLLFGQDTSKWRFFQEKGLSKIRKGDNEIISLLKLSYHNLESPLKACFKYCALFPKNFVINKRKLVSFWMANGYILPFDGSQSIEDAGEEYFSILLRRCFFQDVKKDEYGEVYSCKVHDLMHDVAQDVAGTEMYSENSVLGNFDNLADTTRHLFHIGNTCTKSFSKIRLRSYLRDGYNQLQVDTVLTNWRWLRVLDLHDLGIKLLPDSISKLLHLRFLDLSENRMLATLPDSITKLYNLQTLDVSNCVRLLKLPKDLSKLVNLRHLLISGCLLLYMPQNMGKLTCLRVLSNFAVASTKLRGKSVGQLEDLKALMNLRGSIVISILGRSGVDVKENDKEGGYLRGMEHLQSASINFGGWLTPDKDNVTVNYHIHLLKNLQPHSNLRAFELIAFQGAEIPKWGREWATCLPNLVKVKLRYCDGLLNLPSLSKLHHLKSLELVGLTNLEYVENTSSCSSSNAVSGSVTAELVFFPSLESLSIFNLPELKGWWGGVDLVSNQLSLLKIIASLHHFLSMSIPRGLP